MKLQTFVDISMFEKSVSRVGSR